MNTHAGKNQKNKSRSIANDFSQNRCGKEPTFQFVDNRPEAIAQRKLQEMANNSPRAKQLKAFQETANNINGDLKITQFRKNKAVESSAQKHYDDGWGAKYNIQTDEALKGSVSDEVKGNGDINLGIFEFGNRWIYKGDQYKKGKKCNILYKDAEEGWGKYKSKLTSIYHCGPTGEAKIKKV